MATEQATGRIVDFSLTCRSQVTFCEFTAHPVFRELR
jgi:hypothetical protein